MNWYYAAGGQQQGPVDDVQLDALIQSGTVTLETLVWREGMGNWLPLRQARPAADGVPGSSPSAASAAPPAASALSGAHSDDFHIPEPPQATVFVGEDELLTRDYRIEIGEGVERGWKVVTSNFGLVLGASVLLLIIFIFGGAISGFAGIVLPFADYILPTFYTGPLMAGFMFMLLKLLRGEGASVGDAFSGFSRNGLQVILGSVVQGMISFACILPALLTLGITGSGFKMGQRQFNFTPPEAFGEIMLVVVLGVVGFALMVYVNTLWTHSLLLVVDKGYKFWPAMSLSRRMVSKRWWMTFLFLIVAGIIYSVGFVACCIGLFVSIPVYFGMKANFYDDNFRSLSPAAEID